MKCNVTRQTGHIVTAGQPYADHISILFQVTAGRSYADLILILFRVTAGRSYADLISGYSRSFLFLHSAKHMS